MDDSLQLLITNVGFPIALSMYLLVRIEGKLSPTGHSMSHGKGEHDLGMVGGRALT